MKAQGLPKMCAAPFNAKYWIQYGPKAAFSRYLSNTPNYRQTELAWS
jgi:hypothetical protein